MSDTVELSPAAIEEYVAEQLGDASDTTRLHHRAVLEEFLAWAQEGER